MRGLISSAAVGMLIACAHTEPQVVGQAGNLAPSGGSKEQSRPQEKPALLPAARSRPVRGAFPSSSLPFQAKRACRR